MKIILCGCNGAMGRTIQNVVANREDMEIVAGIDLNLTNQNNFPIYQNIMECDIEADIIIDFSKPTSVESLVKYAQIKGIPYIEATTGLGEKEINMLEVLAIDVPVLQSGNTSLGLNLIAELSKMAAPVLADSFDVEIEERHHNKKVDAPSGAAMMIFNKINEIMGKKFHPVFDRNNVRQARDKNEIGISSLRGGNIVGEHTVIFAGNDEIIEITHKAGSKNIFANGVLKAAEFLIKSPAGKLYNMNDVIAAEQKQDNIMSK